MDGHTYLGEGWGLSLAGVWASYQAVEKMFIIDEDAKAKKIKQNFWLGRSREGGLERERPQKERHC